jgi:hypothetical protein
VYCFSALLVTGDWPVAGIPHSVLDREVAARVDPLAKILARLEMRDVFSGKRNGLAGLRVSADTRRTKMQ